jgi:hypothetical protein
MNAIDCTDRAACSESPVMVGQKEVVMQLRMLANRIERAEVNVQRVITQQRADIGEFATSRLVMFYTEERHDGN